MIRHIEQAQLRPLHVRAQQNSQEMLLPIILQKGRRCALMQLLMAMIERAPAKFVGRVVARAGGTGNGYHDEPPLLFGWHLGNRLVASSPRCARRRRRRSRRSATAYLRGFAHGLDADTRTAVFRRQARYEASSARCTQRKPSCLVMAAIPIAPPTDFGKNTAKRMKPIVVSTRKRARSTASWIGIAGTASVA